MQGITKQRQLLGIIVYDVFASLDNGQLLVPFATLNFDEWMCFKWSRIYFTHAISLYYDFFVLSSSLHVLDIRQCGFIYIF